MKFQDMTPQGEFHLYNFFLPPPQNVCHGGSRLLLLLRRQKTGRCGVLLGATTILCFRATLVSTTTYTVYAFENLCIFMSSW